MLITDDRMHVFHEGVETKQTNDEKLVDAASRGELDAVESFRKMGASVNAVNRVCRRVEAI